MSLFITFEGGEGSGKSVQAHSLYNKLLRSTIPAVLTHEPGGTPLGEYVRGLLKWTDAYISPEAELLMFNASRAQLLSEVILPNIGNGKVVICDRFVDSTIAYQGYGRGLDLVVVRRINDATVKELTPNLTVLLDIPFEKGLDRVSLRSKQKDRFERENIAFHQRVREGYLKMAANEPERWLVIDATQSREKIAKIIWQRVSQLLARPVD
ncbi:MAG: dTMP kinase [Chloroflexi bacterium]|nr:dTMP kinase [Chloroflexota bacterium]